MTHPSELREVVQLPNACTTTICFHIIVVVSSDRCKHYLAELREVAELCIICDSDRQLQCVAVQGLADAPLHDTCLHHAVRTSLSQIRMWIKQMFCLDACSKSIVSRA